MISAERQTGQKRFDYKRKGFVDIAKEYHVSIAAIIKRYERILFLKAKYYVNHLSIVHGYKDTEHFEKIRTSAFNCYCGGKYIVAYFEKEYADILKEYRNGEPGMPKRFLKALPPLRNNFSTRTVSGIIRLRETDGLTYTAIAKAKIQTLKGLRRNVISQLLKQPENFA